MMTYSREQSAFYILFIRHEGLWIIDSSSWDKQEMLTAFHEDSAHIRDRRLIKVPSDCPSMIRKARKYLEHSGQYWASIGVE